jgi:alpha-glucosidase
MKYACSIFFLAGLILLPGMEANCLASSETNVRSPNNLVQFQVFTQKNRLHFKVTIQGKAVIETSPLQLNVDDVDLAEGVEIGKKETYHVKETYPWRGVHAQAVNHCQGITIALKHVKSNTNYTLEIRVFDDGAAFRFLVPDNGNPRVPDEGTTFVLPGGSTVWYHGLEGHYEGVHVKKPVSAIHAGEWAAPPLTFKLPAGVGYAAITEAALVNYSGMASQADGQRGFRVRLGHLHPACYPFRLRYGMEEAKRLSQPAAIRGTITTPWRVVMAGADLNTLVNCDIIANLCPPPDAKLFPKGLQTEWIKPGRAVWKYLDGGQNTLQGMKDFCRLAEELGFEHHIIEGFWARWSDAELADLVRYAKEHHVQIWFWKHSKELRDPQARHDFFKRCRELGIAGAKIDFFDHEAKEVIDLYQSLLRETAENQLLVDFHGANKPTGEARTWPNELTREAVKGLEARKLADRAAHNATLPFTRWLAGPAEYTPLHFGDRRLNTTWAHQAASAAILSAPLLTYAAHPTHILANPCCDMIKSIPSTWDETRVLPPSEIGEVAVFARRSGNTWFLAVMNGAAAKHLTIPLSFLSEGTYRAALVRDSNVDTAAVRKENAIIKRGDSLTIDLREGGGFIARFSRNKDTVDSARRSKK